MKTLLAILLALLAAVPAALVLAAIFVTGEHLRPYAEDAASEMVGRPVRIGSLQLHKDWHFGIEATGIRVANAEWGEADHLASIGRADVVFRVLSVLEEQLDFPKIEVSDADIFLEVDKSGRSNSSKDSSVAEVAAPDERSEFPIVRELRLNDIKLSHRDQQRGESHTVMLDEATGSASAADGVALNGNGSLNGQPLALTFTGGSFEALVDGVEPYPIDLTIDAQTKLRLEGTLVKPTELSSADLAMQISGSNLYDFGQLLGLPLPSTSPFELEGQLITGDSRVTLRDFSGTIGDSDATGTVSVNYGGKVFRLEGDIRSDNLDLADLGGLIGAKPDAGKTANKEQKAADDSDGLIPDTPVPVDALRSAEIDLHIVATKVSSPVAQVESIDAKLQLEDSRLLVHPVTLGVSGGTVSGEIALNVREQMPSADIKVELQQVEIKPFFKTTQFVQEMGGTVSGALYLLGTGENLDAMVRSARGNGHLVMRDGMISGLLLEAAGLDVTEALGLLVGGDAKVPIRCAVAAVIADRGKISIQRGAVDTTDSLLVTEGQIDLASEQIQIQVEARAKDFSLIDASAPVQISGTFSDPSINIGGFDPLPFFELGDQPDVDCSVLINAAREVAPGKPE